jgi:hypothetical protein
VQCLSAFLSFSSPSCAVAMRSCQKEERRSVPLPNLHVSLCACVRVPSIVFPLTRTSPKFHSSGASQTLLDKGSDFRYCLGCASVSVSACLCAEVSVSVLLYVRTLRQLPFLILGFCLCLYFLLCVYAICLSSTPLVLTSTIKSTYYQSHNDLSLFVYHCMCNGKRVPLSHSISSSLSLCARARAAQATH